MGYAALLAYVTILFIRPQEWMPLLYGVNVLDYVMGVGLLALVAHMMSGDEGFDDAPQNWLMLGLFGAVLMSHVRHTNLAGLTASVTDFGKTFLFYLLIISFVTTVRRVRGLIVLMVVGCLFMSIHGIMQAHTGAGFGGAEPMIYEDFVRVRAFGIFHDPNDLSLMLVATIPFLLGAIFTRGTSLLLRILAAGTLVPFLYCIYLTNSRGGWLALAAMVFVFAYVKLPYKKVGFVLGLAAIPLVIALGPSRTANIDTSGGSVHGRLIAWGDGIAMLKTNPLFGVGHGRYTIFSERTAHNSFVLCWGELGLVGYFFWLGMILAALKDYWAFENMDPRGPPGSELKTLYKALTAGLMGFLAAAFFLSRSYLQPLFLMLGLFAAMRAIHERQEGDLEDGFHLSDWPYLAAAAVGSIIAMYLMVLILNTL